MGTRTNTNPNPNDAPRGQCLLCGKTVTRRGMTTHLRACRKKRSAKGSDRPRRTGPVVCLVVEGSELHWLHLEIDVNATLDDLDRFLRSTWLECCGHLSDFEIDGARYVRAAGGGWLDEDDAASMDVLLESVLRKGTTFRHTYDYGSTTQCRLRVTALDEGPIEDYAVEVLARNEPPVYPCNHCGQPAVEICTQCMWEGEGWLCASCAKTHECGEDMLLPVVDSPRVGVCGYAG